MKKQTGLQKPKAVKPLANAGELLQELRSMIEQAKQSVAIAINSSLTALYWRIGCRIRSEILQEKRAVYGKEIVATLSRQLAMEFGQGFAEKKPS